jgi:hypothetical protein
MDDDVHPGDLPLARARALVRRAVDKAEQLGLRGRRGGRERSGGDRVPAGPRRPGRDDPVVSFLHRYVAGLGTPTEPAYRRCPIPPRPGGGLTWAQTAHDSPYGRIEVRWSASGNRVDLSVSVPPGTTADVTLPDGSPHVLAPGDHHISG